MALQKFTLITMIVAGFFLFEKRSLASAVHSCFESKGYCTVQNHSGQKNDTVKFVDLRNRSIAVGKVIRKTSRFAVVKVLKFKVFPRSGDRVLIMDRNKNSPTEWAGAFSFDK